MATLAVYLFLGLYILYQATSPHRQEARRLDKEYREAVTEIHKEWKARQSTTEEEKKGK